MNSLFCKLFACAAFMFFAACKPNSNSDSTEQTLGKGKPTISTIRFGESEACVFSRGTILQLQQLSPTSNFSAPDGNQAPECNEEIEKWFVSFLKASPEKRHSIGQTGCYGMEIISLTPGGSRKSYDSFLPGTTEKEAQDSVNYFNSTQSGTAIACLTRPG